MWQGWVELPTFDEWLNWGFRECSGNLAACATGDAATNAHSCLRTLIYFLKMPPSGPKVPLSFMTWTKPTSATFLPPSVSELMLHPQWTTLPSVLLSLFQTFSSQQLIINQGQVQESPALGHYADSPKEMTPNSLLCTATIIIMLRTNHFRFSVAVTQVPTCPQWREFL